MTPNELAREIAADTHFMAGEISGLVDDLLDEGWTEKQVRFVFMHAEYLKLDPNTVFLIISDWLREVE